MLVVSSAMRLRVDANSFLSRFEPLALLLALPFSLVVCWFLHSVGHAVYEKGLRTTVLGLFMCFIKLIPGVKNYIDAEKSKLYWR